MAPPVRSLINAWEKINETPPPPQKSQGGNSITTDPGISAQPKQPDPHRIRAATAPSSPKTPPEIPPHILHFKRSSPPTEIPPSKKFSERSSSLSPTNLSRAVLKQLNKQRSELRIGSKNLPKIPKYKQSPEKAIAKMQTKWTQEAAENRENLEALEKILTVSVKYSPANMKKISDAFEKTSEETHENLEHLGSNTATPLEKIANIFEKMIAEIHANLETLVSHTVRSFDEAAEQTRKDCLFDSMLSKREQGIVPKWQYIFEDSLEKLKTLTLIINKTGEYCGKEEVTNAFAFVHVNSTLHNSLNNLVKSSLSQFEQTIVKTKIALVYLDLCNKQEESLDVFFNRVRDFITNMKDLHESLSEPDVYIVIDQKKEKKIQKDLLSALDKLLKTDNIWMKKSIDDFKKILHSDKQSITQTFLLFEQYFKVVRHVGKIYIDHFGYKVPSILKNGEEYYSPREKAKSKDRHRASDYLYGIPREMSQFWDIMEKGIEQADQIIEQRKRLGFPCLVEITLLEEFRHLQNNVLETFQDEINRSSILFKQKKSGNLKMHKEVP